VCICRFLSDKVVDRIKKKFYRSTAFRAAFLYSFIIIYIQFFFHCDEPLPKSFTTVVVASLFDEDDHSTTACFEFAPTRSTTHFFQRPLFLSLMESFSPTKLETSVSFLTALLLLVVVAAAVVAAGWNLIADTGAVRGTFEIPKSFLLSSSRASCASVSSS
jgi:hypothetical protein